MSESKQTVVMKFGGTSVGSVDALAQATQIIRDARAEYPRVVVITSAMSGVTDLLLKCATLAAHGQVDLLVSAESTLREKHFSAANVLIRDEKLREGSVLPADDVWIWTDVDGVMTADPRLVPSAKTLPAISYSEIAELAYYGAKVLHPKTIRPVVEAGIGLRICNTFNPSHPGTRLIANGHSNGKGHNGDRVIKAVTAIRKQKLVTIEGRGMLGVPGVAARAFGAVASTGTSVPLITQASSEQSICFAIPTESADQVLGALQKNFAIEISERDIDRVWATDEIAIITVVGAGMRHTPGVAGKIFSQLGNKNVNVLAIAQGSSEVSISLVVDTADTECAVKALHELIWQISNSASIRIESL